MLTVKPGHVVCPTRKYRNNFSTIQNTFVWAAPSFRAKNSLLDYRGAVDGDQGTKDDGGVSNRKVFKEVLKAERLG